MSTGGGRIRLGHGGGGEMQRSLIEEIRERLASPLLDPLEDGAILQAPPPGSELVFTTDSYVISPLDFPGGNLGKLAVCGTVNDLAVMGAHPKWLSAGLIIEEGLELSCLLEQVEAMAAAAHDAGVQVVTGDTKVVERGKGDQLFINTAGVGLRQAGYSPSAARIAPGQALVVSGTLGDHSIAVMLSREGLGFETDVVSDCAPLNGLVKAMYDAVGENAIAAMRDLTRGGLAAVLNEFAVSAQCDMFVDEAALPIRPAVATAARVLGFEPSVLANEGKLLAVVDMVSADALVAAIRQHPYGKDASVIGSVGVRFDPGQPDPTRPRRPLVQYTTPSGGRRIVDLPLGELLPRIC